MNARIGVRVRKKSWVFLGYCFRTRTPHSQTAFCFAIQVIVVKLCSQKVGVLVFGFPIWKGFIYKTY
jgi:hypothetical protein